jgi:glycosyltransferase involved in cell wall biosynthesis
MWSVCVIARDEEARIGTCLASAPASAERVVVVDDRTTDGTARWAERAGARVLVRRLDTFAAQRNAGLEACRGPWVLFLDADERLSDAARSALATPPPAAGLSFPFETRWLGRTLRAGRMGRDRKVRAVRKGAGRWEGAVHERLVVDGPVAAVAAPILHEPYRDWWEHAAAIEAYARLGGRRPRFPGERAGRAALHLVDALVLRAGWRDGVDGAAVAALGAVSVWRKWSR